MFIELFSLRSPLESRLCRVTRNVEESQDFHSESNLIILLVTKKSVLGIVLTSHSKMVLIWENLVMSLMMLSPRNSSGLIHEVNIIILKCPIMLNLKNKKLKRSLRRIMYAGKEDELEKLIIDEWQAKRKLANRSLPPIYSRTTKNYPDILPS